MTDSLGFQRPALLYVVNDSEILNAVTAFLTYNDLERKKSPGAADIPVIEYA